MKPLILVLILVLSGCSTLQDAFCPTPIIPPNKVVNISIEPCELLREDLVIGSFEDALFAYADLSSKYGTCAIKQADSIRLIKEFSNKGANNGSK